MRKFDQAYTKRIKLYEAQTGDSTTNDPFKKKQQQEVVQITQAATNPAAAPNPAAKPAPGAPATTQAAPPGGVQGQATAQPVAGATTTPQAAGAPAAPQQAVAPQITPANIQQTLDSLIKMATTDKTGKIAGVLNQAIQKLSQTPTGTQQVATA